ncbi:MAG: cbb3-type cytochrome oxidase assembly protein CcoS [Bdellovibrionales bacterium]|nr:cbb3-type cytochrome oxidase assembly protein CcoS [Bdellovibrionales bacterium]
MSILAIMIPITLLLAGGFLALFFWAVGQGQFEDLVTPAHELLVEDELEECKLNNNLNRKHQEE